MAPATAAILWRMDTVAPKPPALVGLRLFALVYDLFPVLALWMLASLGFTLAYTAGGHDVHDNEGPRRLYRRRRIPIAGRHQSLGEEKRCERRGNSRGSSAASRRRRHRGHGWASTS